MQLDSRYRQELQINLLQEIRIPEYCQESTVEFLLFLVKLLTKRGLVYVFFARIHVECSALQEDRRVIRIVTPDTPCS